MGKSAEEHEAIITAAVRDNDKLGWDVLVFSGTSDNEPSVALGVDHYLNFSGAVRCCCHTLALAVNDAVRNCNSVTTFVQRINCISVYLIHAYEGGHQVGATYSALISVATVL